MMKKILLFLLLAVFILGISAQGPSKKCPVCGLSIPKCQYKGKHPKKDSNNQKVSNLSNHHECVDLGLPSGTKWATYNIGASKPSDYGSLFSWGETRPKKNYLDSNYKFYQKKGSTYELTKYSKKSSASVITLDKCDDAASVNWGNDWKMPTAEQFEELYNNCIWADMKINGHRGVQGTSKINGKKIFFPAAGFKCNYSENWADLRGVCCIYFSNQNTSSRDYAATIMYIDLDNKDQVPYNHEGGKTDGCSIRAVKVK